jgi:hypothetical protein
MGGTSALQPFDQNELPGDQPYGINRPLVGGTGSKPAATWTPPKIGVHYGISTIGWASIYFDGNEVWGGVFVTWNRGGSTGIRRN